MREIKEVFVDEPDQTINPMGIKGLGEAGIGGAGAAIANAILQAETLRLSDLPHELD